MNALQLAIVDETNRTTLETISNVPYANPVNLEIDLVFKTIKVKVGGNIVASYPIASKDIFTLRFSKGMEI